MIAVKVKCKIWKTKETKSHCLLFTSKSPIVYKTIFTDDYYSSGYFARMGTVGFYSSPINFPLSSLVKTDHVVWSRASTYNNPSYSRILIGSHLGSIRGQMHDWRHHYKGFPSAAAVLKWRRVLRITDNILRDWVKGKVQKSLAEELNKFEKQEEER